jgi:oxygen-independent coproporphyrinogen III oxidase
MKNKMALERGLIDKYGADTKGPYYTSYPTLGEWSEEFSDKEFMDGLKKFISKGEEDEFSLYVHYPFCVELCHFCICNAHVTNNEDRKKDALEKIISELDFFKRFFDKNNYSPKIKEIHLGGGSPSFLNPQDFERAISKIKSVANIKDLEDFALEIDPRTATPEKMHFYAGQGIDRISFGIQDFNPDVQKAVNRVQPLELVESLISPGIRKKFKSLNFDILYGLPMQTLKSFSETIETVKRISPERITLLRYAHIPERVGHMRLINKEDIVGNEEKTEMFIETVETLLNNGYEHVGIDNFAKSNDDLAKAFREKKVGRNFVGFTPGRVHNNMIGVGPSATSVFGDIYSQNVYHPTAYSKSGVGEKFPIDKGHIMNQDDIIRRDMIFQILCNRSIDWNQVINKYNIDPTSYFQDEMNDLQKLQEDGLVTLTSKSLEVTPPGRFFIRHIAKPFDKYLRQKQEYKIHGT